MKNKQKRNRKRILFTLILSIYTFGNPNFCIVSLYILNLKQALDFFFLWLRWVFVAAHGLSLVAVRGLLIAVASLVAEHGL